MFSHYFRAHLLLLLLCLSVLTGCQTESSPGQLPEAMLDKLDQVHAYQLSFLLEASGQSLRVCQWYQAPDLVRTDVYEAEQAVYSFISSTGRLQVADLVGGYQQDISLTADNALFVTPLLLDFCRLASQSPFALDETTGLYSSSFCWSLPDGSERQGQLLVDRATLLPTELLLSFDGGQVVRLKPEAILLNPVLDSTLFSFDR